MQRTPLKLALTCKVISHRIPKQEVTSGIILSNWETETQKWGGTEISKGEACLGSCPQQEIRTHKAILHHLQRGVYSLFTLTQNSIFGILSCHGLLDTSFLPPGPRPWLRSNVEAIPCLGASSMHKRMSPADTQVHTLVSPSQNDLMVSM